MDQLLLWISMAFVVFLAARRRDRASVPWFGIILCASGIGLLSFHALRDSLVGNDWSWMNRTITGSLDLWRLTEIGALIIVGVGVVAMTVAAETERTTRRRGRAARSVTAAPSVGVVMSVLSAAPGATLMLRRDEEDENDFRILYADESAQSLLTLPARGAMLLSRAHPNDTAQRVVDAANQAVSTHAMTRIEHPVGEAWYEIAAGAHADGVLVLLTDITERKRAELALTRVAYTDPVTGLANRTLLEREMDEGVEWARANPGHGFAVVCLDFDDFKGVNDRHGHSTGDALLVSIGTRISALLEEEFDGDTGRFVAARWGGDEFVVMLKQVTQTRVASFANRLCERLALPHELKGVSIRSTASAGAAMCTGAHAAGEDVLKDADEAMYVAKNAGKNRVCLAWENRGGPSPFPGDQPRRRATDIGPDTRDETAQGRGSQAA